MQEPNCSRGLVWSTWRFWGAVLRNVGLKWRFTIVQSIKAISTKTWSSKSISFLGDVYSHFSKETDRMKHNHSPPTVLQSSCPGRKFWRFLQISSPRYTVVSGCSVAQNRNDIRHALAPSCPIQFSNFPPAWVWATKTDTVRHMSKHDTRHSIRI